MARKFVYVSSRSGFDVPLAAFAALAVAFVAWVMPEWRFQQMVELSGLPGLIPAAQPPLGGTARMGVAAAGGAAAFVTALLLLRLAERFGPRPARRAEPRRELEEAELPPPPPRLRRSAAHPDAPARRPICAASDFGEPAPAEDAPAAQTEAPVPFWHPEDFPAVEAEEAERWEDEREIVAEEPAQEEAAAQPQPLIEEPEIEAAPLDLEPESIADLMTRLERGLSERSVERAEAPEAAPPVQVFPEEAADARLRSAIESLQQMTGRSG